MRDPRETLSMLTARGIDIGKPFGGIPTLTALDVAGAIGMCMSKASASLLLAKYTDDQQQYAEARVYWFEKVMERKADQGWKSDRPGLFKGLADTTLAEHIDHNLCRWCKGTGYVMSNQKPTECQVCKGTGRRYYRPNKLAIGIGIKAQSFGPAWRERVEWCRVELNRWEADSVERLGKALRSGNRRAG